MAFSQKIILLTLLFIGSVFIFSKHVSAITTGFEESEGYAMDQDLNDDLIWYNVGTYDSPFVSETLHHTGYSSAWFNMTYGTLLNLTKYRIATTTEYTQCSAFYFTDDDFSQASFMTFRQTGSTNYVTLNIAQDIQLWNGSSYRTAFVADTPENEWFTICLSFSDTANYASSTIYTSTGTYHDYVSYPISTKSEIRFDGGEFNNTGSNEYMIIDTLDDEYIAENQPTHENEIGGYNSKGEGFVIEKKDGQAFFSATNFIFYTFTASSVGSYLKIIQGVDDQNPLHAYESDLLQIRPLTMNDNFLASTTLTSDGTQFYCVVLDSQYGEEYDISICDISRTWLTDTISPEFAEYIDERMATTSWCNCDDIATSTGIFTELVSDFQCSARKTACWLFFPKDFSSLTSAINYFKSGFPFSVISQIKDEIDTSISQAVTTDEEIEIAPLMWAGQDTGVSLLTNKTLENGMGSYLYEKYYTWFTYLIYLFGITYFLRRILKLSDSWDYRFRASRSTGKVRDTYGRDPKQTEINRSKYREFRSINKNI